MYSAGLTSLSYEKPALYLLSVLLGSGFQLGTKLTIPSDMGELIFKSIDLIQVRGKIPLLKIDFEEAMDQTSFEFQYFGHVAPQKFHSVKVEKSDNELIEYTFADVNKIYGKLEADYDQKISIDSIDIKLLCGSLYLWRSCVALPKICEESLSKYFKKMKSVSRYEWNLELYFVDVNKIIEKWSCVVPTESHGDKWVSVELCNGIVENVCV
ncbi:hypothetical protein [Desulfovibrio gilichinskyi]|uniref:Uncharacterized protein n=1 Tax=Desulfovibrio gilichinskyi TaxID=1519643 RepID=A0A1X7CX70_9BACT|nr:hypothetical protein [Desulfovibrio gilichinskyi]SMF04583.1 hypothetical protein SAMN06295933_1367 [Desulfovibrio gilichinskyi]